MVNNWFIDTESIGFYGATIMLQYCHNDGDPVIHNIWDNTVQSTLDLIERQLEGTFIGFNLVHDMFHYHRTYNVLQELPKLRKPDPIDYLDVEASCLDKYCLKPKVACDLMLIGRRSKFQATLNQKPITMRKVPRLLAPILLKELTERVPIPSIYFSRSKKGYHWYIADLIKGTGQEVGDQQDVEVDPDFVNLKLNFSPSTSLKAIMAFIGHEVTTLSELPELSKPIEYEWWPTYGGWYDVFPEHYNAWKTDPRRNEYALKDPLYTRELWEYLGRPEGGDNESELACAVGGMHWRGFAVDVEKCKRRKAKWDNVVAATPINVNAPRQVKAYLCEVASPLEQQVLLSTSAEVLEKIAKDWKEDNPELARRAKYILASRQAKMKSTLMEKLIAAGRMHVVSKVTGTKSNRSSGGSENYITTKGSINHQGIPAGPVRFCVTLAHPNEALDAGDFDGFEVSIAEACYNDPELRKDLLTGKKVHALFGSSMYGLTYDEVRANKTLYQCSKTGFFAFMYGAEAPKLSQAMGISKEEAVEGLARLSARYVKIGEKRAEIQRKFTALAQPEGIGTEIKWMNPAEYEETFLGFRRYFTLEISTIKALFEMARNPSPELKAVGSTIRVVRRERVQTGAGAANSAIYAVAFGLQGNIFRAAANHDIQSPGAEITKDLQRNIWDIQPMGINSWVVMPLNIHDEVECPCIEEVRERVKQTVTRIINKYKDRVPLISMSWKQGLRSWGEK